MRALFAVLMLVAVAGKATAQVDVQSAEYYMPQCRPLASGIMDPKGMTCAGMVAGVWLTALDAGWICHPEVNLSEALGVVVQYVQARPARMNERFNRLALEALRVAWPPPCQ